MNIKKLFQRYGLAKSPVFELNPNRKYLIGIDHSMFSQEDARQLGGALKQQGITNTIALFRGDPNKGIKIIKQKKLSTQNQSNKVDKEKHES